MKVTQQSTKLDSHIEKLQRKHDELDRQIKEDYIRYGNDVLINDLKKRKLSIKDEIEHYKQDMVVRNND